MITYFKSIEINMHVFFWYFTCIFISHYDMRNKYACEILKNLIWSSSRGSPCYIVMFLGQIHVKFLEQQGHPYSLSLHNRVIYVFLYNQIQLQGYKQISKVVRYRNLRLMTMVNSSFEITAF